MAVPSSAAAGRRPRAGARRRRVGPAGRAGRGRRPPGGRRHRRRAGYSALAYLKSLPVDTLKLAKPFVDGLLHGAEEAALTNAILRIADLVGLQVIAEGIEEAQARELERLGCPLGQGFHFARPLDQFAVEALLVAEQGRRPSAAPAPRLPVV